MAIPIKRSSYPSYESQKKYIQAAKESKEDAVVKMLGMEVLAFPKVYGTKEDTELLARTAKIKSNETFLELGTGCGIVALYLSKKALNGTATDINPRAVENAIFNAKKLRIENIRFIRSDLFSKINEKYDVILFNPPYSSQKARDAVEKMFWDTGDRTKTLFFEQVSSYLKPGGRIYFGWADFSDLDVDLPWKLAKKNGLIVADISRRRTKKGYSFYVLEMAGKRE